MFGYVVADRSSLTEAQISRYQSCYCGLCHCIGSRYGSLKRAALNYDMTFLVLLLSSLYETEERHAELRCIAHPVKLHPEVESDVIQYAAAMNVALAYYNCMDDWHDERKLKALALAGLFRSAASSVREQYPDKLQMIEDCLDVLSQMEQSDLQDPDQGANAFGALMGALFVWKEDRWSGLLRQMGEALGRFIYLMDAVLDLPEDLKKDTYNPLRSRAINGVLEHDYTPVLKLLLGECTDAFERLPLVQDYDLMRNILYSGVWTKYAARQQDPGKEEHHV